MMERLSRYLSPLVTVQDRMPWFLPVVGTVLLAVSSNLIYDASKTVLGFAGGVVVILLLVLFGVAIAVLAYRRTPRPNYHLKDKPHPRKHSGLIALVSNPRVVEKAIEYHLPDLKCCWLVVTPEMMGTGADIQRRYLGRVTCHLAEITDEYDSGGCNALVRGIFTVEVAREGLTPDQVIADITGGTKPMTAGMLIACLSGGYAVEHVPTAFEYDGPKKTRRATEPLDPIEIKIQMTSHALEVGQD
ncbi:MAG: hypothetical protein U0822_08505 [Anaerolineae bacterium]